MYCGSWVKKCKKTYIYKKKNYFNFAVLCDLDLFSEIHQMHTNTESESAEEEEVNSSFELCWLFGASPRSVESQMKFAQLPARDFNIICILHIRGGILTKGNSRQTQWPWTVKICLKH